MKTIPLTQGKVAIIDDGDFELVSKHKWYALKSRNTWYACTNGKGTFFYMHRLIMSEPKGFEVHHINRNGLDNKRENLRICTTAENQHNRPRTKGLKMTIKELKQFINKAKILDTAIVMIKETDLK